MGSGFSSFLGICSTAGTPAGSPETGLGDLPESMVGNILVHLTPQEISRLAGLNRAFHGASSADFVWESKLPENYNSVISRVFDDNSDADKKPLNLCKRDIYARLSQPNSIDGDTKVQINSFVYLVLFIDLSF